MSGITFQYLRDRDLGWLSEAADQWDGYADSLQDVYDDMVSNVAGAIVGSSWSGGAASQAGEVCDEMVVLLQTRQVRAAGIAAVLSRGYDDLAKAQSRLRATITEAEQEKLTVRDDGTVVAADSSAKDKVAGYQASVDEYLGSARSADDGTTAAIKDLVPEDPGYLAPDELRDIGGDLREHLAIPAPPKTGSAQHNADWWRSLSEAEQTAYLYGYPTEIGFMDGIGAPDRHVANLITLREDAANGQDKPNAEKLLDRIEKSRYGPEDARLYLLGYEGPGPGNDPDAKAIVATGDPDTAKNTAVFVPGVSSDLGNMGGSIDRMDDLRAEAGMIPGSQPVSTIVWLGYDPPDNIPAGILSGPANEAAPHLRSFTEGLQASHTGASSHTTVIGHSYGSTVVGTADALGGQGTDDGLQADDIIVAGSPGMGMESPDRQGWFDGPMVDNVSDMHIDPDHFWSAAARDDLVSYTEIHGNSPVDVSFGGQRFSTDGASGHSEYWNPGTESLRNQAYILTGQYDQVDFVGRRFG